MSDDVFEKDITQQERVEPVAKSLGDMGTFYKKITTKLTKDGVCYICKKTLDKKDPFDIIQVPDKNVDKGLIAFVCTCKDCNTD